MSKQTDGGIKAVITKDERLISNYVKGEAAGGITFTAKIFDVGSVYGIDNGRVSKLDIRQGGKIIVNYDRGWDVKPKTPEIKAVYKSVMATLNALDKVTEVDKPKDFLAKIEGNKQKVGQSSPAKSEKAKGEELC
jgi:hypothetical protein